MPATMPLVALDLDGTLLDHAGRLPEAHCTAVRALTQERIPVAIVTGRPLMTARWVWERLALATPLVCFNGGWLGHADGTVLDACALDEASTRAVLSALAPHAGTCCAYPDAATWLMDRITPWTSGWEARYGAAIGVAPARFADWRGASHKVMFVTDPVLVPALAADLDARFQGRFHITISQSDRIEILPAAVSKAWGLARLAERLGVPQAQVWAVGDADNDREMVAWAGHGCAMGHGTPALKAVARHVLPGIEAHGLAALPALVRAS